MSRQTNTESDNIFNTTTALTEKIKMITKGKLPNIPKEITIKGVQRKDKKRILLNESDDILMDLLQACIVSPDNMNVYDLLPFESKYLLYRLRVLTYGPSHTFKDACPHCKAINDVEMNLNDIPIIDIPDNFNLTFEIPPLPVSGISLTCKLLTEGEIKAINTQAKEIKDATGDNSVDVDLMWENRIVAINGNGSLAPIEKTQILDNLSDYDSEYFMEYYFQYAGNYGLQTKLHYKCDKCNKMVESNMPSIYTFFRPTIKINNIK